MLLQIWPNQYWTLLKITAPKVKFYLNLTDIEYIVVFHSTLPLNGLFFFKLSFSSSDFVHWIIKSCILCPTPKSVDTHVTSLSSWKFWKIRDDFDVSGLLDLIARAGGRSSLTNARWLWRRWVLDSVALKVRSNPTALWRWNQYNF